MRNNRVGDWTTDQWYTSSDISELIQTFIDRPDYSPGNHVCIRIDRGDASDQRRRGWDYSVPSNPASGQVRREDSREIRQVHAGEKTKGTFQMTFSSVI